MNTEEREPYPVEMGTIIPLPFREEIILITSVDLNQDTGTFKVFASYKDAREYCREKEVIT